MSETFEVRVTKDYLVFSAAHFITFEGNVCERLHGHNYRVEVHVQGPLDENHYVVDFIALLRLARTITDRLDHRVLLPTQSPVIHVRGNESQVTARFEDRVWMFPKDDCVLLEIPNTTAELLARWIAGELEKGFDREKRPFPSSGSVRVEENFGQWASYSWQR